MSLGNELAFPVKVSTVSTVTGQHMKHDYKGGLTKLEYFAVEAMRAWIGNAPMSGDSKSFRPANVAIVAVAMAIELEKALEKVK